MEAASSTSGGVAASSVKFFTRFTSSTEMGFVKFYSFLDIYSSIASLQVS